MEIVIKTSDIEAYRNKHASDLPSSENQKYRDGDIVKYNNNYYVLTKRSDSSEEKEKFDLYTLDSKLFKENIDLSNVEFALTKEMYLKMYDELKAEQEKEQTQVSSSSGGSYYSGGGGGGSGYSKSRTSKSYSTSEQTEIKSATQDKTNTEVLEKKLGSEEKTKRTVEDCQDMINKAEDALRTANITVSRWEDTQNANGYAAKAAIVYLNNLSNALTKLESNLDKTKLSALEVNDMNHNVKELLVDFVEKDEKETAKKEKEAQLQSTPATKTVTNSDGTTRTETNPEYTKIQSEITTLTDEIAILDKEIEQLQIKIDDKYKTIQTKYGSLINFDSSNKVSVSGSTIFGKGGNNTVDVDAIDGDVIKNYMISNNLEYFEYGNSIYNIASPLDPWTNLKLNLEEKYLIKYDLDKLTTLANGGNPVAQGALEFIKGKANGSIGDGVRHFISGSENGYYYYSNGGYQKMSYTWKNQIPAVMDTVLDDTYKANGCKTVTDYATTAMAVMSGGIWNGQYGGGADPMKEGTSGIIGGSVCISAVNWAEAQGLIKAEGKTNIKPLGLGYGIRTMSSSWDGKSILPVGTVVTSKSLHDFHIGIIIGHTTIDGVKYNVVGQTGNRSNGYNAHVLTKTTFDTQISSEELKSAYCA